MGLTISNLFQRLFGKRQMRILMGKRRMEMTEQKFRRPLMRK